MVLDGNLSNTRAGPRGIDRNEPVHLAIEPDVLKRFAPISFQRTAIVVERYTTDPGNQAVRNHRWNLARDHLVFPILSPTRHNVIAFVEFVQQPSDVGGI